MIFNRDENCTTIDANDHPPSFNEDMHTISSFYHLLSTRLCDLWRLSPPYYCEEDKYGVGKAFLRRIGIYPCSLNRKAFIQQNFRLSEDLDSYVPFSVFDEYLIIGNFRRNVKRKNGDICYVLNYFSKIPTAEYVAQVGPFKKSRPGLTAKAALFERML